MSVIGFFITGILAYPYGCHWDSGRVFSLIYTNGEPYLNNWMGWYYPYLWYWMYKISGIYHIMGLFQVFLYWVGITTIYLVGCSVNKKTFILFICFAFFPTNLFFITSITNNALVYCYFLMSFAFWIIFRNIGSKWALWCCFFMLINVMFVRRDTFLFVVPLALTMVYVCDKTKHTKLLRIIKSIIIVASSLILLLFIEHSFTKNIQGYNKINNVQYIALYDITGMSRDTGKLLWPRSIIADEWVGSDSIIHTILGTQKLYGDVEIFYDHNVSKYLKTHYHLAPDLHEFMPIYLNHIPEYIRFRCGMVWTTITDAFGIIHQCDGMKEIDYPISGPRHIHNVLAWSYPKVLRMALWYILLCFILISLDFINFIKYRENQEKIICRSISISSFFTMIITCLCLISNQNRYFFPYFLIIIGMYLFIYCKNKYHNSI